MKNLQKQVQLMDIETLASIDSDLSANFDLIVDAIFGFRFAILGKKQYN